MGRTEVPSYRHKTVKDVGFKQDACIKDKTFFLRDEKRIDIDLLNMREMDYQMRKPDEYLFEIFQGIFVVLYFSEGT